MLTLHMDPIVTGRVRQLLLCSNSADGESLRGVEVLDELRGLPRARPTPAGRPRMPRGEAVLPRPRPNPPPRPRPNLALLFPSSRGLFLEP